MSNRVAVWIGAAGAVALALLSGCTAHINGTGDRGTLAIQDNAVRIRVPGKPSAYVHADGELVIAGHTVTLTPADRALAQQYYEHALGISTAGEATGQAGGQLGVQIVGSLFAALWQDNSAVIDRTAHRGSARVSADVRSLCSQMAGLVSTQKALVAAVPAFAPYSIIRERDVRHCFRGAEHKD